nr:MAG TPA: hypothetical protein [Caudoviricetes sp.]
MNYLITRDMDSDSDYIKHYGVLGMKWGRRYQSKKKTVQNPELLWILGTWLMSVPNILEE